MPMLKYEEVSKEECLKSLLYECLDFLYQLPSPPLELIQQIEKIMEIE